MEFVFKHCWCWLPNNKTTSPSLPRPHCRPRLPSMKVPTYLELEKISVLFDLYDYSSYRAQPTLYLKEVKSLTETNIRRIPLWGTFYLFQKFSASERLQISWRSAGDLVERSYLQICKCSFPEGTKKAVKLLRSCLVQACRAPVSHIYVSKDTFFSGL